MHICVCVCTYVYLVRHIYVCMYMYFWEVKLQISAVREVSCALGLTY